ncbi:hypothetical protein [Dokdonia donghaensis]|uniref:Uncharacterized protein n=1 Tax=Dokdonia donghaensis DSW-1 TaxID=1300343 RepID=A0A0A2GR21_9FLAO|nr:hypothetical protein [Dokdonia donghaensis]ANH61006.1 hypothetical protein I597_2108 [Dokdonia donghaensis DSW-1]KGO05759.1 hypothetical protein NV36_02120 [Dokdonia donghaensis DSW-1]
MKTENNIPKHRGFSTPENYFQESKEHLLNQIRLDDQLSDSSSSRFDVPDDYFATSKEAILDTLSRKRTEDLSYSNDTETKVISLKQYLYPIAGIAAALLLLVSIVWTQVQSSSGDDITTIAAYFDDEATDLEGIEFAEWLTEDDINDLQNDLALDESVIIDYLDERLDGFDLYID